jgi:arylformamidase
MTNARTTVFLDYTQEELDRAYDQRAWAANATEVIARYTTDSAAVRARLAHRAALAYGPDKDEVLDYFPAASASAPIHVFVHGGAWRMLTKDDAAAPAPTFVAVGVAYVALNFSVIPNARLPEIADQLRRAIAWIWRNAAALGGDANRITISGHSSGAHLASVLLTTDWSRLGVPGDVIKGAICLSGMYDLAPVMLSARAAYVSLSPDEIAALSAMRHLTRIPCPVIVGHGERESPEFQRQSREFAAALGRLGKLHREFVLPGLNHFEVVEELNRAETPLTRATFALLDLAPAA